MALKKSSPTKLQGGSSRTASSSKSTSAKASARKSSSTPKARASAKKSPSRRRKKSTNSLSKLHKALSVRLTSLTGLLGKKPPKKRPAGKGRPRKKNHGLLPRLAPVTFAFMAGIIMAAICFFGIQAIQQSEQGTLPNTQSANTQSTKGNGQGKATPLVLPAVGEVAKDQSPLENNMEAALAIQQALAELQVAASTDRITQFTEQTKQANFALLQAAVNTDIPPQHIRITKQEEQEHQLGQYTFQRLTILGPENFPQILANSLHSWHSQARLFRMQPNLYAISIQGVTTHELTLYTKDADFKRAFSTPVSPKVPSPPYPTKRGPNAPAHIVIVIDDLGASPKALNRLIRLNYPVTCAFWPDAAHTSQGARKAHSAGLEILIHMPMEPLGYPKVKPGTNALLSTMNQQRITTLVQNAIHKVPHAVGLNNHMGSKFTQHKQQTRAVLNVLVHNKLFMLDSVTHGKTVFYDMAGAFNIPRYKRSVFLDADDSPAAITAALAKTERIAKLTGQAIAIGHPLPSTLTALEQWQRQRDTSIKIVKLRDLPNNGL